jgi:hypothetical protein
MWSGASCIVRPIPCPVRFLITVNPFSLAVWNTTFPIPLFLEPGFAFLSPASNAFLATSHILVNTSSPSPTTNEIPVSAN